MIIPSRRRFLLGAGALLAAPAIVRKIVLQLDPGFLLGAGAPVLWAPMGSLYARTDALPTAIYVNTDGACAWTKIVFESAPA